jgi:hypothetical protein
MDAILEEVLGVEGFPSDRSSESAGPPIGIPFAILGIAQIPRRIDILLYLSEHKKSTEISALIFTVTQTAMFVKYPLIGARESG